MTIARPNQLIKFVIPIFILFVVLSAGVITTGDQQFSDLAKSFWHGHSYLSPTKGAEASDYVPWRSNYYWALGPLPAVVLMPMVGLFSMFHASFHQGDLQWLLVLGVMFFIFKIARTLTYSTEDSLLLAFGFTLGSAFIGLVAASTSWYFSQVLATFLIFWSLYEFYSNRRWWIIGAICGLLLITRISAASIIVFFSLEVLLSARTNRQRFEKFTKLYAPFLLSVLILSVYNFSRFHNIFEQGYQYQTLSDPSLAKARSYGLFSLVHLPGNFFYAFLSPPLPVFRDKLSHVFTAPYIQNNQWGMSIFVTSPYLLYLATIKKKVLNARSINLIIALLVSMTIVFLYYGIGFRQFGYRYSLDFLPLMFLLFMIIYRKQHKRLTSFMSWLLVSSGVINFYLLLTFIRI